jgi:hypothetical protein
MAALHAIYHGNDKFFVGLNNAFLKLIPKGEAVASGMKDFRPISLVHSFAKLLAKILAMRLAPKMHDLVDPSQSAFIRGRCIQDNFVLVQQSAATLHRHKIPALLMKLDIAKAFDSVSWPFLVSVLRQRGFGNRWIRWILLLLRSASTKVLVNRYAGDAFRHARGLRQGDPLSPLLFVIVMDALAGMFRLAEQLGVLESLRLAGIKHRISLYADDLVVFARPEPRDLQAVHAILRCFGGASALHVNLSKSASAPIRCSSALVDSIAPDIACPLMQFPCVYLGLPLSIGRLCKGDLQLVLDKLAAKLPHWKARLLTKEGRVTYVHAIMTASVVYQLLALDMEP